MLDLVIMLDEISIVAINFITSPHELRVLSHLKVLNQMFPFFNVLLGDQNDKVNSGFEFQLKESIKTGKCIKSTSVGSIATVLSLRKSSLKYIIN